MKLGEITEFFTVINRRILKNYHDGRIRQLPIWGNKSTESSKKQLKENAIYNLLSEKLEVIAINKDQLTERLNDIV